MKPSVQLQPKRNVRIVGVRLIVDGMNVVGSRPDGWWRDREGAMRRLVEAVSAYASESGGEVTVVLDARPFDLGDAAEGVMVRFAPGGRNAGDDEIVRLVEGDPGPQTLRVVTSDRELMSRVRALGARVVPAGEFRAELDRFENR
jgi:predicted RNA-binding protein with PIN domain